jgi:hypothetical protein
MKLIESNEDVSSVSPLYEIRGGQVTGLESRFMFISGPKREKVVCHFAFATEQIGEIWLKLLFERASFMERKTKMFPTSVAIPEIFREEGDIVGGSVLEPEWIRNEWIEREEGIPFKEIRYGEQTIKLKSPIKVEVVLSDERCSLYYEPLDILVSAPTLSECEEDFQEEFNVLYEEYAEETDEKLTESAQELKRTLLNLVKVEP